VTRSFDSALPKKTHEVIITYIERGAYTIYHYINKSVRHKFCYVRKRLQKLFTKTFY